MSLTTDQRDALHVLRVGMASLSGRTESRLDEGVHTVKKSVAKELVELRLARDVKQWDAVEITQAGITELQAVGG